MGNNELERAKRREAGNRELRGDRWERGTLDQHYHYVRKSKELVVHYLIVFHTPTRQADSLPHPLQMHPNHRKTRSGYREQQLAGTNKWRLHPRVPTHPFNNPMLTMTGVSRLQHKPSNRVHDRVSAANQVYRKGTQSGCTFPLEMTSGQGFEDCRLLELKLGTEGYARVSVIGSGTSFVIASVRSSTH